MAGIIAALAGVIALERFGDKELIDNDYKDRIISIPCQDTTTFWVFKDSFQIHREYRAIDVPWIIDSINIIYKEILDTTLVSLPLPDSASKLNVTADTVPMEDKGTMSYVILSEGPVFRFASKFDFKEPDKIVLKGKPWSVGVGYGRSWTNEGNTSLYQLSTGYKNYQLYYQTDWSGHNQVLASYQYRF